MILIGGSTAGSACSMQGGKFENKIFKLFINGSTASNACSMQEGEMKKGNVQKNILLVCILLAVNILSGCSKGGVDTETVTEKKKIVIGSDIISPYLYKDTDGEFMGIDVEIATEALHRMGYEPEFKLIVWENKNKLLEDGELDCIWGCFSMNGREDKYLWAGPYLYSRQMVAVRMDSEIQKLKDLTGKMIAVQETSKAEEYFLRSDFEGIPDVSLVYCFSNMDEVFAALRKNYVEAICGHESALISFINTAPDEYRLLEESFLYSALGVAFDIQYDEEFVEELVKTLVDMMNDGTTAAIVGKYGYDAEKSLGRGND